MMLVNYVLVAVFAEGMISFTFIAFGGYLDTITTDSGMGGVLGLIVIALS